MDRTDMLIIESNGHNPDVNLLFNRYTLVRIEYLIGCDRAHEMTKIFPSREKQRESLDIFKHFCYEVNISNEVMKMIN